MKRRTLMLLLGGAAAAWPLAARAQQPAMPVIGFLRSASLADVTHLVTAFRHGLRETGYVEDQPSARPFRWINLAADARTRMYPASDQLATHERIDENYKGHERRVPRVLHGQRNGIDGRGDRPPGESVGLIQGPLEVAVPPGTAAPIEERQCTVVGDGLSMALHRRNVDHPRPEHPVQLLF